MTRFAFFNGTIGKKSLHSRPGQLLIRRVPVCLLYLAEFLFQFGKPFGHILFHRFQKIAMHGLTQKSTLYLDLGQAYPFFSNGLLKVRDSGRKRVISVLQFSTCHGLRWNYEQGSAVMKTWHRLFCYPANQPFSTHFLIWPKHRSAGPYTVALKAINAT